MQEYSKNIDVHEAHSLIQSKKVTLIDVREKEETDAAFIEGAQLAPLSDLVMAINACEIDKDKPVLFYCLKGGRSKQAGEFLAENLLRDVEILNMVGGIKEWVEEGYPIVTPD